MHVLHIIYLQPACQSVGDMGELLGKLLYFFANSRLRVVRMLTKSTKL